MDANKDSNHIESRSLSTKKYKIIIFLLALLLTTCIGIILILVTSNSSPLSSIIHNEKADTSANSSDDWQLPKSNKEGYALILTNEKNKRSISVVSIDEKKIIPTQLEALGNEDAKYIAGIGSTDPITSPDFKYFVYIDKDADAVLVANGTYEKSQITNHGRASALGGWSKDSKNVVFSVTGGVPWWDDLRARPDDIKKLPSDYPPGYYNFNIETGETTYLFPLKNFLGFIDNERILTNDGVSSKPGNFGTLEVFNINSFEMDYTNTDFGFGFGVGDYEFDSNGDKWTFSYSDVINKPIDDNTERVIVYADFPNIEGKILDRGSWAGVHSPKFSPDRKYIAYQKRGRVENNIILASAVYDLSNNLVKLNEGEFVDWLNNKLFLIKKRGEDKIEYNYFIANVEDKSIVAL